MNSLLQNIREFFQSAPCKSCQARDYTIAILKEELYKRDGKIQELEMRNDNLNMDLRKRLDFVTGIDRHNATRVEPNKIHSVPRTSGIQDRIRQAEIANRDPALAAQRKKEYEDRISEIEKPEFEAENASG